ncbi:MAG: hypothetical protein WC588_04060 [Candidatus Micrarchaeia archaeon]
MEGIAQQVSLAKLTPKEVHDKVMSMGVSDLDAGLVADCLNVGKSTSWMNNDMVSDDINGKMKAFLAENGFGFEVTVTPVRCDKFIWDVKKRR